MECIAINDQVDIGDGDFIEIVGVNFDVESGLNAINNEFHYINAVSAIGSVASASDGDSFIFGDIDLTEFPVLKSKVEKAVEQQIFNSSL